MAAEDKQPNVDEEAAEQAAPAAAGTEADAPEAAEAVEAEVIEGARGSILDRNGRVLARSVACRNVGELSLHNRPEGGLCARLCLYRSAMETETL